uniref:Astacin domain-containing protein n=1 Tax=Strongyloides papillosus TaxID=174720 RepID=A0A0N5BWA1_STREA
MFLRYFILFFVVWYSLISANSSGNQEITIGKNRLPKRSKILSRYGRAVLSRYGKRSNHYMYEYFKKRQNFYPIYGNSYIISPWSSFEVDVNCIKFCMNRGCTHCCRSKDSPRDINCLEKAGFFLQGTGEYTRL